jgi:hypothetical protein
MPKVQRKDIPRALLGHLLQRIAERSIDADALKSLASWLDTHPDARCLLVIGSSVSLR